MYNSARRLLILALCMLLSCSALAGCTASQEVRKDGSELQAAEQQEVLLTFYFLGDPNAKLRTVLDRIEQETKETLNIKLDFQWRPGPAYLEEIRKLVGAGEGFEALITGREGSADLFTIQAEEGLLMDITTLFPEHAPKLYEKYTREELEQATYRSKLLGIPFRLPRSYRMSAIVRADLLAKYGVESIRTYRDLEQFWKLVRENEAGILPAYTHMDTVSLFGEANGYVHLRDHLMYEWDDPQRKLVPWEQTPAFSEALHTLQGWYENGFLLPGTNGEAEMKKGNLASFLTPLSSALLQRQSLVDGTHEYRTFPLYPDKTSRITSDGAMIALGRNAANPGRTLQFLEWVQDSQEHYDLLMYGIRGQDFELDGQGRITFPQNKASVSGWQGSIAFLNFDYYRITPSEPSGFKEDYIEQCRMNARYAPDAGFIPDDRSLGELPDTRDREFRILEENVRNGIFSVTAEEFVNEQKALGVDRLVDEMQKQLAQWAAEAGK